MAPLPGSLRTDIDITVIHFLSSLVSITYHGELQYFITSKQNNIIYWQITELVKKLLIIFVYIILDSQSFLFTNIDNIGNRQIIEIR